MLRSSLAETVNVVFGLVEPDHSLREQLMSSELVGLESVVVLLCQNGNG
jgi:hypothetical protein